MPRSSRQLEESEAGAEAAPGGDAGDAGAEVGDTTVDALLSGRVILVQPRRGFRSSLDPLLLARFLAPPYGRFLDIGCGTGALSFTLLADDPAASGVGVRSGGHQPAVSPDRARGLLARRGAGARQPRGHPDPGGVAGLRGAAGAPRWPAGRGLHRRAAGRAAGGHVGAGPGAGAAARGASLRRRTRRSPAAPFLPNIPIAQARSVSRSQRPSRLPRRTRR